MKLEEKYLGIKFSISDNGDGTFAWALSARGSAADPADDSGRVPGGQNEAILAARKAIGKYAVTVRGVKSSALSERRKVRSAERALIAKLDRGPLEA
jgi:hypothetical protein